MTTITEEQSSGSSRESSIEQPQFATFMDQMAADEDFEENKSEQLSEPIVQQTTTGFGQFMDAMAQKFDQEEIKDEDLDQLTRRINQTEVNVTNQQQKLPFVGSTLDEYTNDHFDKFTKINSINNSSQKLSSRKKKSINNQVGVAAPKHAGFNAHDNTQIEEGVPRNFLQ